MNKRIDLTGKVFEWLTVESYSHTNHRGEPYWNCICKCGNKKTVVARSLKRGTTRSCGCLRTLVNKNKCNAMHMAKRRAHNLGEFET